MKTETKEKIQYKIVRIKEHEKYQLMTYLDLKEGKLYIRIIELNTGKTEKGQSIHKVLPSLTIFEFPTILY